MSRRLVAALVLLDSETDSGESPATNSGPDLGDGDGEPSVGGDGVVGLAVSPDATRLVVAYRANWGDGWIDRLTIPVAQRTPIIAYESIDGSSPVGLVVDGGFQSTNEYVDAP